MSEIERIVVNTINQHARGDPDALAARIVGALARADIASPWLKTSHSGLQPFDELTPEKRPQDHYGDSRDWIFETCGHGGAEPDSMPAGYAQ